MFTATLVPNRSDVPRYATYVRWEARGNRMVPVRILKEWMQVGRGEWRWMVTRVTELRLYRWPVEYPKNAPASSDNDAMQVMRFDAALIARTAFAPRPSWSAPISLYPTVEIPTETLSEIAEYESEFDDTGGSRLIDYELWSDEPIEAEPDSEPMYV